MTGRNWQHVGSINGSHFFYSGGGVEQSDRLVSFSRQDGVTPYEIDVQGNSSPDFHVYEDELYFISTNQATFYPDLHKINPNEGDVDPVGGFEYTLDIDFFNDALAVAGTVVEQDGTWVVFIPADRTLHTIYQDNDFRAFAEGGNEDVLQESNDILYVGDPASESYLEVHSDWSVTVHGSDALFV